jgi:hypothetical protein
MKTGFALVASFAIGFGIIGWGVYCIFRSRKASGWPSVLGTMNACEIKRTSDVDGTTYRVHAGYSYEVYGRPYQGDRIALAIPAVTSVRSMLPYTISFPWPETWVYDTILRIQQIPF